MQKIRKVLGFFGGWKKEKEKVFVLALWFYGGCLILSQDLLIHVKLKEKQTVS